MLMDQMVLTVTMKENVLARSLLLVISANDVVLDTLGFQNVKVGLTVNNVS